MNDPRPQPVSPAPARFLPVLAGVSLFLAYQYTLALLRLTHRSAEMEIKFNALARDKYMTFLIGQNVLMIAAYAILAVAGAVLLQPAVSFICRRLKFGGPFLAVAAGTGLAALVHFYCMLRLVDTRPYFLQDASFGASYYRILDIIPAAVKPQAHLLLFHWAPALAIAAALLWQIRRRGKKGWIAAGGLAAIGLAAFGISRFSGSGGRSAALAGAPPNIVIIGSDSLRGDKLGFAGYRPARGSGPAAAGVSPAIDALAARSARFENCYSPIASTMESGTTLMSSQYPSTHGLRHMYPDRETARIVNGRIVSMATLLRDHGYETAAIGDWCAGYYDVMPLGFQDIWVSSFDNFKTYMSQAVVMAHFVIPLYFDNPLGYLLFPDLKSFAQFVTPQVVTQRVEDRLAEMARKRKPFFWHIFYSSNHLPYRSVEPYCSMFTDPAYKGNNKGGVIFDINEFIGGTDLESKWKALPAEEVAQIRALYDGCTRQFDDCVARILAALKKNGLADNTIVIITADHGDDLYEPGVTLGHGLTFNGGLQANHIPMVIHVPGTTPASFPETIRTIDVVPTLADLAGIPKPAAWEGKSVAGWIRGTEKPEWQPFYGETGFPFIQFSVPGVVRPKLPPMDELTAIDENFNYQFVLKKEYEQRLIDAKQRCLRTRYWKLVCTPGEDHVRHYSLFFLPADPHGETDLAATRPEVLAPMRAAMDRWIDTRAESPIAAIFPGGEPQ